MKLIIDKESCKKNGISLGEALALLAIANDVDIGKSTQVLVATGLVTSAGGSKLRLTNKGSEKLSNVVIDSIEYTKSEEDRLSNLARKLQEIYPSGRKDGTNYLWRGTVAEIVRKLKTLETKYKFKFTDEQAIKATEAYVQSFNGNYRFMQLLKYFILKTGRDEDGNTEIKSEFMALIENEGHTDRIRDDWMSTMV